MIPTGQDSLKTRSTLTAGGKNYAYYSLDKAAAKLGDFQPLHTLQALVASPFDERPGHDAWAGFPPDWASHITISCSS